MTIYFSTNVPELRSIMTFNRLSLAIAQSTRRLETGQRINTAADDPSGLVIRESMRADIKGIESAVRNTSTANNLLSMADSGMATIVRMMEGDMDDDSGMSLLGIIADQRISSDEKKAMISDILNAIDATAASTTYGGKQIINGDLAYRTSGVDQNTLKNLQITRANAGMSVKIVNTQAATRAALTIDNDSLDNDTKRAAIGDTITVGLQNGASATYTLQAGDVDDGQITASAVAKMNTVIQGSGVTASFDGNNIVFNANQYGSDQTLTVTSSNANIVNATKNDAGTVAGDATGVDAKFKINGNEVTVKGTSLSYASSDLRFDTQISESLATTLGQTQTFQVTGGGATFQLGKNVTTDMQLNMGIPSMRSSQLGGADGVLADLLSLDYDNPDDTARAAAIARQAIDNVTFNRARIGTLQKSVIEPNGESLDSQLLSTTESEAAISNTDTALESSRLARNELLAQAAMQAILYNRSYAAFVASVYA